MIAIIGGVIFGGVAPFLAEMRVFLFAHYRDCPTIGTQVRQSASNVYNSLLAFNLSLFQRGLQARPKLRGRANGMFANFHECSHAYRVRECSGVSAN
eukprot:1655886-Prymnesium_polylepis.1